MPRAPNGNGAARADYLWGDPAEREPITGGHLDLEPGGLHFHAPSGRGLELSLDSLLGISISGRTPERTRGRKAIHGTLRIAGLSDGEPAEWVFAVDRSEAARLQAQLNHELGARGRDPLPHVEELIGFPLPGPGTAPVPRSLANAPSLDHAAADLGHHLAAADRAPTKSRVRKVVPWALLGVVLIAAEVVVPLLLLRGG